MTARRIPTLLPVLALMLAASPLLLLIHFYAYVLRDRLHLGHWPYYNHPDPKQLGWVIQHVGLQLGFTTFPALAFAGVILAIVGRSRSRAFPIWTVFATAIAASATLVVLGRLDPGGFMDWFWD